MALVVDCTDSMYNYECAISAVNLVPYGLYEIKLLFFHKSGRFRAYGVYKSDANGTINLSKCAPVRGTYTGIRKNGLFESYEPLADFPFGGYAKYLATETWNYELRLSDSCGKVLDSVKMTKRFMHPSLKRVEIEEAGVRGTLFIPPGDGPFPAIVDFSGTGGGINEQKGAALASEGFCVLTIAFFQFKDLPVEFGDITLEYFINCVNWLASLPYTTDKVAIHANSMGGIIALLMARECPQVCAVVSINPPHGLNQGGVFRYKGELLPHSIVNFQQIRFLNEIMCYDRIIRSMKMDEKSDLHFETISKDVSIRFVVSLDDLSTCAHYSALYLQDLLRRSGHIVEMDWQCGGHLMEPPCFPHHSFCFTKISGMFMGYGGETLQHGESQPKVWKATVDFLRRSMNCEGNIPIMSKI